MCCSRVNDLAISDTTVFRNDAACRRLVRGQISLEFSCDGEGRTFLDRQYASYPFHVCKAQYHDPTHPNLATLYTQSCSGGLYEYDRHEIELTAQAGAQCHVTTQASTIVHSMPAGQAQQEMKILAHAGSYVEFLPDPQILFPQSRFSSLIRIRAAECATVLVSDSFLMHDPQALGAVPDFYGSEIVVEDAMGRPLAIDRLRLDTSSQQRRVIGITGNFGAQGTVLVVCDGTRIQDILNFGRQLSFDYSDAAVGLSALPNGVGLYFRCLAHDGAALKSIMQAIWNCVRLALKGDVPPRRRK